MREPTPTPICDFVRAYAASDAARLHMPGHKGKSRLGCEPLDITEIDGADALFEADGVIAESERYASMHFGCPTLYSTEGSSLCIRAMLFLAIARKTGAGRKTVLAARNAHRVFLSAAALLDFDPVWLGSGYLSVELTPKDVEAALLQKPDAAAVYLTSPDYLGHTLDIAGIAKVCRAFAVPLLVDNAHGAYLKFLPASRHPIDLGADMVCDSAHKTLPALTGTAYLHIAPDDGYGFFRDAKRALALFGSTSPSYLLLQSLDLCNRLLDDFPARLLSLLPKIETLKAALAAHGYVLLGDEPCKLTVDAKAFGYTGDALAAILQSCGIIAEFHDPDYVVLMLSPDNTDTDLKRLSDALLLVPPLSPLAKPAWTAEPPTVRMTVREATFAPQETVPVEKAAGRVLASPCVGCPPAVPVVMCGETITEAAIRQFCYYGIRKVAVVL